MCGNKMVRWSAIPVFLFGLCASALSPTGGSVFGQVPDGYELYPLYNDEGTEYPGPVPVSRDVTVNPFGGGDAEGYVRLPAGSVVPEPTIIVHLLGLVLGTGLWLWWRRSRRT